MRGFTLIEILVSLGIIAMLLALTLINFRGGERQYSLDQAAQKLAQDIHRVQNLSLAPTKIDGQNPIAFYIEFQLSQPNSYGIFADFSTGPDKNIETVQIQKGIKISQLQPGSSFKIIFNPPDPTITISVGGSEARITLAPEADSTKTRTVLVNIKGLIQVE